MSLSRSRGEIVYKIFFACWYGFLAIALIYLGTTDIMSGGNIWFDVFAISVGCAVIGLLIYSYIFRNRVKIDSVTPLYRERKVNIYYSDHELVSRYKR